MTAPVRAARPALLLLLMLSFAACSSTRDPRVRGVGVSVTDVTDEAMALRFDLTLANANGEPLKLLECSYTVRIGDRVAYVGRRAPEATIPGRSEHVLRLPAVVRFDHMGWGPAPPVETPYEIEGYVLFVAPGELERTLLDTGLKRPTVSFRERGAIIREAGTHR